MLSPLGVVKGIAPVFWQERLSVANAAMLAAENHPHTIPFGKVVLGNQTNIPYAYIAHHFWHTEVICGLKEDSSTFPVQNPCERTEEYQD